MRRIWLGLFCVLAASGQQWLTFEGSGGPGKGKRVVLVSGDEEYRSEEMMPQLARILSKHHGFQTTVLFALDPDGAVNPNRQDNIPGLEALAKADLLILFTRFRDLPDEQMKRLVEYIESGRPIIGLRTATHAFDIKSSPTYASYTWKAADGGFGRRVLGETWIDHHGQHGKQSTRAVSAPGAAGHPILTGIPDGEVWGPTDVYRVKLPLPGDSKPLLMGQVLTGMNPDDPPVTGPQNEPLMPVAWTRTYKEARVFTTTMGSSQDLMSAGFRRLLVNATYWALGMEGAIRANSAVDIVGVYDPHPFGFNAFVKGRKPAGFAR